MNATSGSSWTESLWVDADGVERRGGARDAFYGLPISQQSLVVCAVLIEAGIFAGQKTIGFKRLTRALRLLSLPEGARRAIARRASGDDSLSSAIAKLHLIAHEMTPLDFDCVTSSAALWWYLRNAGCSPELHVGVRSFGGVFNAHAWVTLDDRVMNDIRGEYRDYRELPGSVLDA